MMPSPASRPLSVGLVFETFDTYPVRPGDPLALERGLEILAAMRARTSGFAILRYVLDTSHGKVPLERSSILGREGDDVLVEAWNGETWREPNPPD